MKQSSVSPDLDNRIRKPLAEGSLSLPVGDHGAPALSLGHVVSLDGLSHAANLVDLQQQTVAGLLLNSSGDSLGVGDQQVVSNNLDAGAGGQLGVTFPIILVKGILNTEDRVVADES